MSRRTPQPRRTRVGAGRGSPMLRLRVGFVIIAMMLSVLGARLVQLQGLDPDSYAAMAAAEDVVEVALPAERGDILDRNGLPLADSIAGKMVVADPSLTAEDAPALATILSERLGVDYFTTLQRLRGRSEGSRFEYVARRVPSTRATDVVDEVTEAGFEGISTREDPVRDYPAGDVAANLVGFVGIDTPLAGFEATFEDQLAGTDGSARYEVGDVSGNRVPLGESSVVRPRDGEPLRTTLDLDLQWFTQRVLAQQVEDYGAESGTAVVMDSRTGELLALADVPTYDANKPENADKEDRGARALSEHYEPGSVEKVLTAAALIDAGKVTARTKIKVPPVLRRQDRPISDWFAHETLRLTLAGVIAQSSNIGTVLAADAFSPTELVDYLRAFGLGERTAVGVRNETPGILTDGAAMTSQTKDRVTFGQSLSVNAVQMTAAINTIANGGVYVSPSLVTGRARTADGVEVGTDTVAERQVVGSRAARQTTKMMELVVDEEAGVAPAAQVEGYLVAGKTGTAQRVAPGCGCYDGSTSVSFAGFAPADDPRFTVYVVIHAPSRDAGGGSTAGPVFSRIMGWVLGRYGVPPTGGKGSTLPTTW